MSILEWMLTPPQSEKTTMYNGFVLYEGRSVLNGDPIVAIATLKSRNSKTGNMAQIWILHMDQHPIEASKAEADIAICGDCPFRGNKCYVNIGQAPAAVWRAYKAGKYPQGEASLLQGYKVRHGAYGDPAALPVWVNAGLMSFIDNMNGYTHQWRRADAQYLADICMASVHSPEEMKEANRIGWRTFRTRKPDEPRLAIEAMCPASKENGQKLTCAQCMACGGHRSKNKANITIIEH